MKIISLTAENFKRLVAVEIKPSGEVVTISGKNGAGKSSVLDSIWAALVGGDALPSKPIRVGENKARVKLDLGEVLVERRFTQSGATLTVTKESGALVSSPQAFLDSLIGALSFDPLEFVNISGEKTEVGKNKKRLEMLRAVVKLDVDVDALDGKNATDFAERTDVNREAKSRRAQADGIKITGAVPATAPDIEGLTRKLADAAATNSDIEARKARRSQAADDAKRLRANAEQLRKQAESSDAEAKKLEDQLASAPPLPEPVNVESVKSDLDAARLSQAAFDANSRKQALLAEAAKYERRSEALTSAIEARKAEKERAIASAKMPVAGIGFDADGVTFNGIPFAQLSSAEQLKISVAVAMAANPKIRIIRIADGSLLDDDNLAVIRDMARDNDFQIWLEKVDSSGKIGIVIEDGAVASVNAEVAQ